jgi:carbonic anhydrase/acetyltransferase-like protein (isoleucine patch superfamily)
VKKFNTLDDQLDAFLRKQPVLGKNVYIARGAVVLGDVTLGDGASVWYNAVLRGDINRIVVGAGSNIQDNSVLHLADDFPCVLGDYVTIGHSAIVHACSIGDECLIGMGAVILDGAELGAQCLVGAKALITQHTKIPAGSLVLGAPAKVIRPLTPEERGDLKHWAEKYVANAAYCLRHNINVAAPPPRV